VGWQNNLNGVNLETVVSYTLSHVRETKESFLQEEENEASAQKETEVMERERDPKYP
jgi:hypothetical protein